MKKHSVFSLTLCLFLCINAWANPDEVMLNNEAAGYVDTIESFINKAGEKCQPVLEKEEIWKSDLLENWRQRNERYSTAIDYWTNTYLDRIDRNYGSGLSQYEEQKILSVIEMRGNSIATDVIKGNLEEKVIACQDFENKVLNGELDITTESPFYDHLEKMVNMY